MAAQNQSLASAKRLSFGHHGMSNASLIFEKQKATLRRSTPDSEALASSDDEVDLQQRGPVTATQTTRPTRRASWMSENHHILQKQPSLGTSEQPRSPGGLPHVPTTENNNWSSGSLPIGRNQATGSSSPWNSTIWNNDSQKGLPSRFAEVLPSPTTLASSVSVGDDPLQQGSPRRDSSSETSIPFAIPLHPTLKSYRSQSYSVGQLEHDLASQAPNRTSQYYNGRTRAGSSYSGLNHRPSRPSILGEFSTDTSLGQLREVEDDEESTASSEANARHAHSQARKIEQLRIENSILRQRAQMSQSLGMQALPSNQTNTAGFQGRGVNRALQISESVLEEPDDERPGEEMSSVAQLPSQRISNGRRQSDFSANLSGTTFGATGDQSLINSRKRGQWQSSLGFGGAGETPQSRRHSFADVPLRHSVATNADGTGIRVNDGSVVPAFTDGAQHISTDNTSFFSPVQGRGTDQYALLQTPSPVQGGYAGQQSARHGPLGQHTQHYNQSLYLVTFKAARAEFYFVQDGTGLEVNPGDLVIVEADRGTDLGTVAHKNVDWSSARELRERYIAEHYNWLMMFSRQGQGNQGTNGWSMQTNSERANVHSAGASNLQPTSTPMDGLSTEIKPKMIKRLAQNHEIHTLREKEGNEAKAKRMCQQKVAEHHLNMEILDAEFQMDWKKLTFYYFADSYINFNSLVTDLFKIYKTRIWMSAINPASFVSPAPGPQLQFSSGSMGPRLDRALQSENRTLADKESFLIMPDTAYDPAWTAQQDLGVFSSSQSPYGQYWPASSAQPAPHSTHEHPSENSTFRSSSTFKPAPYPVGGIGSRMHSHSPYKTEHLSAHYSDQIQALQGLHLGH